MAERARIFEDRAAAQTARADIGRFALSANTVTEDEFLLTFRFLRGRPWPRSFVCTLVDADTGEFVALDQSHGAELRLGVAAGCSIPGVYPPITIHGRRSIDGGIFSPTHLDLAEGHDRILFVNMAGSVPAPEIDAIEGGGAELVTIEPDADANAAIGENRMDASRVFAAVVAGSRRG